MTIYRYKDVIKNNKYYTYIHKLFYHVSILLISIIINVNFNIKNILLQS